MQNRRKCIFHIPDKLDEAGMSGSQVRPRKMIQGFKDIGYEVDVVMGYGSEREKKIKRIKKNIKDGIPYDFMYSESSTTPTLLTEKNHLPRYPRLDFEFFRFCRKHGIKIGLFYRDIYWRFPVYKEAVHGIKYFIAQLAYRYDLYKYSRLLDIFYVPNRRVDKFVKRKKLSAIMEELPPGCAVNNSLVQQKEIFYINRRADKTKRLNLFYVGGIGNQYVFDELLKGLKDIDDVEVTICCREREWEREKSRYLPYITERVTIVHESGDELIKYYQKADICLAFFIPDIYIEMAIPIKLFEYLSYSIPILASNNTATGEFVERNNVGWSINYSAEEVRKLMQRLTQNYEEIYQCHYNAKKIMIKNRWEDRALQVKEQLMGEG